MNISLFSKASDNVPKGQISITDFINGIKYGTWKDIIEPIRIEKDKEKRDILKKNIPAVTISGMFSSARNQNNLSKHSGFISIDIDGYNDKTPIEKDIYTYACFRSASGNGICVLVKINPDKHKDSFRFIQKHYYNTYGIAIDPAPSNIASLRFVSYDTELFLNEDSKISKFTSEPKISKSLPIIISTDKVSLLIKEVVNRNINIAESYDDYLKCGFAIANGFGELGREYFHAIASVSQKYNSHQADIQYDICLKGALKSGITVGTFYFFLKQSGLNIENDNSKAIQIATIAKRSNRDKDSVKKQLIEINQVSELQANKLVDDVYERNDITLKSVAADPERLIESLSEWLKQNHFIKKNSITRNIEEKGQEVRRERLNTIFLRARSVFNTPNVTYDLIERMIFSDLTFEYHPIKEYIEKNSYRNNDGQIKQIIKTISTPTSNADIFIEKWLVSIIAAVNGHPVRSVLSLCGIQNTGKSEWFRRLLPKELYRYYAESKLDAGKDDQILMCQKLIVMDDEMGGKSKQDEKQFKELTSKRVFSLRAPYGRSNEDFNRLAILCGTSNTLDIINDPTGNTRILPIEVDAIDHELYNTIDKDELFMELVRKYESGYQWQLSKEELNYLNEASEDFKTTNVENELLTKLFSDKESGGFVEYLTATEIKDYIEINTKQTIRNMKTFGIELKKFFGKSISKKVNRKPLYVYQVVKLNGSERNSQSTNYQQYTENQIDAPF